MGHAPWESSGREFKPAGASAAEAQAAQAAAGARAAQAAAEARAAQAAAEARAAQAEADATEERDIERAIALSMQTLSMQTDDAGAGASEVKRTLNDDEIIEKLVELLDIDSQINEICGNYICSITLTLFQNPVTVQNGSTYEKASITKHLSISNKDPNTGETLTHSHVNEDRRLQRDIKHSLQRKLIENIDSMELDESEYKQLVPDPANVPKVMVIFKPPDELQQMRARPGL